MEPEAKFKAREMPDYKHFEPAKTSKPRVTFAEFDLKTEARATRRQTTLPEPQAEFKAREMPDFKAKTSLAPSCSSKRLTQQEPFEFATDRRMASRDAPRATEEPRVTFKAREMPDLSNKRTPKKTPAKAATKAQEPKLHSEVRSRSRAEFDR